jgi:hypothetical protein
VQEKNASEFLVLVSVPTQKGARIICIDKKSHHLYLPVAEYSDTPPPTTEMLHPRPTVKPGTFTILDVAPEK